MFFLHGQVLPPLSLLVLEVPELSLSRELLLGTLLRYLVHSSLVHLSACLFELFQLDYVAVRALEALPPQLLLNLLQLAFVKIKGMPMMLAPLV